MLIRHFKGSIACKELSEDKVKTREQRANWIDGWGEESDTGDRTE